MGKVVDRKYFVDEDSRWWFISEALNICTDCDEDVVIGTDDIVGFRDWLVAEVERMQEEGLI